MNREIQILKFASVLFGGKAVVFSALTSGVLGILFAACVLLLPPEVLGNRFVEAQPAALMVTALFYYCLYGVFALPLKLADSQCLRFSPLGRTKVSSVHFRLIVLAAALLFASLVLQPYALLLNRSFGRTEVPWAEVTTNDFMVTARMLLQTTFFVWVLARWIQAPISAAFAPIYFGSTVLATAHYWWWPLAAFLVVAVGVSALKYHQRRSKSQPDKANKEWRRDLDIEHENFVTRRMARRWNALLLALRSHASASSRKVMLLRGLPSPVSGTNLGLVFGFAVALLIVRNWSESGFFVFLWVTFAGVVAMHARAIPLLPSMLLPIGLNRTSVAGTMFWVWFRRDLVFWLTSGLLASLWVALSTRFGVWMPFANAGRFPWAEPDPVVVHPSVGVMSFVAVGLGLALCTRLFIAATPQAASNQARFAWVRGIFVFIPPLLTFAIEVFLREHAPQFPLLGSFTLRVLLAACVVLPSVFFVYFFLMRRAWETANISRVSETYMTTEIKMLQNFLGRIDARGAPRK